MRRGLVAALLLVAACRGGGGLRLGEVNLAPCQLPASDGARRLAAYCGQVATTNGPLTVALVPATAGTPGGDPIVWFSEGPAVDGFLAADRALAPLRKRRMVWLVDPLSTAGERPSAAAVEAARQAFGASAVNLFAVGAGAEGALAYAAAYPGSTRSVVLDSPPAAAARPVVEVVQEVAALCRAEPTCAARFADSAADFAAVAARLEAGPVAVDVRHPRRGAVERLSFGPVELASAVRALAARPERAVVLPWLLMEAAQGGDLSRLAAPGLLAAPDVPRPNLPGLSASPPGGLLVVSGAADPLAPPALGASLAQAAGGVHWVVPALGHGVAGRGCVPELIAGFVAAGGGEGLDPSCLEALAPPGFFVSPTGPAP